MHCTPVQPIQQIVHFLCDILYPHTVQSFSKRHDIYIFYGIVRPVARPSERQLIGRT